eukprot:snap_masked-scaffold_11-processed-gene-6.33-mRNA-1 protein AED:1.00 eAED:1.00 QI:0/-1/0/0/-1/1/1/0/1029
MHFLPLLLTFLAIIPIYFTFTPIAGSSSVQSTGINGVADFGIDILAKSDLRSGKEVPNSYATGTKLVKIFRYSQISGTSLSDLPSDEALESVLEQVNSFYEYNSGGKLSLKFDIHKEFLTDDSYTDKNCEKSDCNVARVEAPGELLQDDAHNVYIYEDKCSCLGFRGLGQVLGTSLWVNGFPDSIVIAHELGHNFGSAHSNYYSSEYGNYLSMMGAVSIQPSSSPHFSIPMKIHLKWLSEEKNIKTIARKGSCQYSQDYIKENFCSTQTCSKASPCTFKIYAHDLSGSSTKYSSSKIYGVRVVLLDDHNYLFLEYRTSKDGLLAVWSYVSKYKESTISEFGPTQIFDYVPTTDADESDYLGDGFIPIGKYWVYDLDYIGAVIYVKKVSKKTVVSSSYVEIEVYFTEATGLETNFYSSGSLLKSSSASSSSNTLIEGNSISCGIDFTTTLKKGEYRLFDLNMALPTELNFISSVSCENIDTEFSQNSGFFVYPAYPLQLELNEEFDPRVGALYRIPFSCGTKTKSISMTEFVSPKENDDFPPYISFSKSNYVLLYISVSEEDLDFEVDYNVSFKLSENYACFSNCTVIKLEDDKNRLNQVPTIFYLNKTNADDVPFYSDTSFQYSIYLDTESEWVLQDNESGEVLLVQTSDFPDFSPDSLEYYAYPNLVSSWSKQVSFSCLERKVVSLGSLDEKEASPARFEPKNLIREPVFVVGLSCLMLGCSIFVFGYALGKYNSSRSRASLETKLLMKKKVVLEKQAATKFGPSDGFQTKKGFNLERTRTDPVYCSFQSNISEESTNSRTALISSKKKKLTSRNLTANSNPGSRDSGAVSQERRPLFCHLQSVSTDGRFYKYVLFFSYHGVKHIKFSNTMAMFKINDEKKTKDVQKFKIDTPFTEEVTSGPETDTKTRALMQFIKLSRFYEAEFYLIDSKQGVRAFFLRHSEANKKLTLKKSFPFKVVELKEGVLVGVNFGIRERYLGCLVRTDQNTSGGIECRVEEFKALVKHKDRKEAVTLFRHHFKENGMVDTF